MPKGRVVRSRDVEPVETLPGIFRRMLATGENVMLTVFTWEEGSSSPPHKHPNEQVSYVVEGELKVMIQGETAVLGEGDSHLVLPNVEHSVTALEKSITIDVFHPPREDFME